MIKHKFFQKKKIWIVPVMELIIGCILIVLLLNYVSRNDMRNAKTFSEKCGDRTKWWR